LDAPALVQWSEGGEARSALWRSERGAPPPKKVVVVDDRMTADNAYGLAGQGVGILWRGDFQNARQLLKAVGARIDRPKGPKNKDPLPGPPPRGREHAFFPPPWGGSTLFSLPLARPRSGTWRGGGQGGGHFARPT